VIDDVLPALISIEYYNKIQAALDERCKR